MKMGIVWDERFLQHETGNGHPERPSRLSAIKEVLDQQAKLLRLTPREAQLHEIAWVHSQGHIEALMRLKGSPLTFLDADTTIGPQSVEAALLAAGSGITCVRAVEDGEVGVAFAFPRPPGHHAMNNRAMGFCLFNNVAIAAESLIRERGKKRVAIVDYDVHHGNGTQQCFYGRRDVFYASTHRFPFYPGTGAATETGSGDGVGFTLNVPLSADADDETYAKAFAEKIIPAVAAYSPEFILVSAGYDAHILDPLGGMKVSKLGFRRMNEALMAVAKKCCSGKIVFILEGGYDLKGLQEGVESVFESVT